MLGIHFLFFCLALFLGNTHIKDSWEYLQQAINIWKHGSWYCGDMNLLIDPPLYSQRPPLYGVFLALTNWRVIGSWFPLLLQGVLSFYNCLLAYKLYEKITGKTISVFRFFLPILFFASQFIYANIFMSEILFQTCWLSSIYFAVCFVKEFKSKDLIFHQLFISAALLVKPIAYVFPLISTLGLIILVMQKKVSSRVITSSLIPLSIIIFIIAINYKHTSVVEYSSIQRKLLINYNMPALLSRSVGEKTAVAMVDSIQQIAETFSYHDRAKFIDQQCFHWILNAPIDYFSLHFKGFFRFFLDHGRWDLYAFLNGVSTDQNNLNSMQKSYDKQGLSGANSYINTFPKGVIIYLLLVFIMNVILLISFLRFLFIRDISKGIRICIAVMVLYLAILSGPTGSARFRVPIYPILLITFAISSSAYINRITRKFK